jgi:hypothetical protein
MNDYQLTTLWLGSLRYYIGRRSAGISDFTSLLIQEWKNLPTDTQNFIKRDLEVAFMQDDHDRDQFPQIGSKMWRLGDDCDRFEWDKVRDLWK